MCRRVSVNPSATKSQKTSRNYLCVCASTAGSEQKRQPVWHDRDTPFKLWNKWREKEVPDEDIRAIMEAEISVDDYSTIVDDLAFGTGEQGGTTCHRPRSRPRIGLCRPDRLLHSDARFHFV